MKKLLLTCMLAIGMGAHAQVGPPQATNPNTLNGYGFAQTNGTYTPLSASRTIWQAGATLDTNLVSPAVALPTPFNYNGRTYSSIFISNNGFITFGNPSTASNYTALSNDVMVLANIHDGSVAGFSANLRNANTTTSEISYEAVGTKFIVQFADLQGSTASAAQLINFQIQLDTANNSVAIVYGNNVPGTAVLAGQVGVRGGESSDVNNRVGTTSWNTTAIGTSNTSTVAIGVDAATVPISGLTFTYSPGTWLSAPTTYATLPFTESFGTWVNGNSTEDLPNATYWRTWPSRGDNSWRASSNTVSGFTSSTGWVSSAAITTIAAPAVAPTARFHSVNTVSATGNMDLYVNLSTGGVGNRVISFDYLNTSGTDVLDVLLSTDGGATFISLGTTLTTAAAWASKEFVTSSTAANAIVRLNARGDNGGTDILVDNLKIAVSNLPPNCTTITAPANAATAVSLTPTITWAAATGGATSYLINLGTTPGGTNVLNGFDVGNVTTYAIPAGTPLNYSTQYYVTIIPKSSIGNAVGCTETSFTTLAMPCPTVSSLATAATGVTLLPTFTWAAVNSATGYKITIGTTSGGTDVLNNFDMGNVLTYMLTTPLNVSTQYFYTITAYNTLTASASCAVRSFTTTTVPPPANDNCSGAIALTVNSGLACASVTAGNTLGASESMAATPCFGAPNDDVWFSFVATSNAHRITLSNVVSTGTVNNNDTYFQVLSGSCGALTSVACSDPLVGDATGLVIGQTYYVRVYSYSNVAGANQSFDICVGTLPLAPANDNCANAISLTMNPDYNCAVTTAGTTLSASDSGVAVTPCTGTVDDDVWYKFTATNTNHRILLSNVVSVGINSSTGLYTQVLSGACGTLTSVACSTSLQTDLTGLTVGQAYYVRVYNNNGTGYNNTFNICIGTPPPPPANDNCGNAVLLTVNPDYSCAAVTSGTTISASASAEIASTCGTTGTNDDVWFRFTATNTAHRVTLSNVSGSTDMAVAAYSGACGSLVEVMCSDPNTMDLTGLTVGQEYKVRVWTWSSAATTSATFDICVGTLPPVPANDNCASATSITVSNSNTITSLVNGNTAGSTPSTGTAPTCSATGINDDVWYSFAATSANQLVHVLYTDNATTTQVYSGACGSLTAVACLDGAYGNSNVLLQNLTVGDTYYVRVYSSSSTATEYSSFQVAVTTPSMPTNDTCATATAISCNGSVQGTNALATDDTLPTSSCGGTATTASYKGVWFTVTASQSGPITIDACGTQYDAYLRVYTGGCSGLTCLDNTSGVGYADAGCTNNVYNAPKVTFTGVAGTTYHVLLTGYTAARIGNYNITVSQGCTTLGTAEPSQAKNNVKAYPNPFTDVLNISDIKNVKSVSIVDIAGRLVKTIEKPSSALQLGELNSGMYMVILNMNDGSRQTIKAIKK